MKTVQKYVQESISDAKTVVPALREAATKLSQQYNEQTHPKLRILDNLIFLSLATFVAQMVYCVAVGTKEPFNAMLAGVFCSMGQFALASKYPQFAINSRYSLPPHPAIRSLVRQLLQQAVRHRVHGRQLPPLYLVFLLDQLSTIKR